MLLSKVYQQMGRIRPGDRIAFSSYGACEDAGRVCRGGGAAIPAVGTVLRVYPRFVLVKLRAARECVLWDSIRKVNGYTWTLCRERGL